MTEIHHNQVAASPIRETNGANVTLAPIKRVRGFYEALESCNEDIVAAFRAGRLERMTGLKITAICQDEADPFKSAPTQPTIIERLAANHAPARVSDDFFEDEDEDEDSVLEPTLPATTMDDYLAADAEIPALKVGDTAYLPGHFCYTLIITNIKDSCGVEKADVRGFDNDGKPFYFMVPTSCLIRKEVDQCQR